MTEPTVEEIKSRLDELRHWFAGRGHQDDAHAMTVTIALIDNLKADRDAWKEDVAALTSERDALLAENARLKDALNSPVVLSEWQAQQAELASLRTREAELVERLRWRDVKAELPAEAEWYLACDGEQILVTYFDPAEGEPESGDEDDRWDNSFIERWLPLPPLPETSEGTE